LGLFYLAAAAGCFIYLWENERKTMRWYELVLGALVWPYIIYALASGEL
jgi:hypothetical protein